MINQFADATDDHQWIHVDVERAKTGPFGGPVAHGYLTLSLVVPLLQEVIDCLLYTSGPAWAACPLCDRAGRL